MTVRLKSIALPPEHGSWGFLLEPLILGLLVAPSWAGACLAMGVTGAFLARQPIKVALLDWQRRKRYARTRAAERIALAFGALGLVGFALAVGQAGFEPLIPFAVGLPLALVLFLSYTQNRGRDLLPELAGSAAMALSAASLVLAGDKSWALAIILWAILMARNIPSILYIRERLHLDKGQPANLKPAVAANLFAVVGIAALIALGEAPVLAGVAVTVLAARALWGLSEYRPRVRVAIIGVQEMLYGLLVVVLTAAGYHMGL